MKVTFACPTCDSPAAIRRPGPSEWQCSHCEHTLSFGPDAADATLTNCPVCANQELYKKKDFPHWLGISILVIASLAFILAHGWYLPRLAWAILIGSAVVDGGLYLWVKDVIVCYRCGAHNRGIIPQDHHKPYDLGIAERYRQERIRREQMR